jgi:hypothetical protein
VPGLLLIGLGLGRHLSRSVSNLGSSFGIAIAGTILVSLLATGNRAFAWAMVGRAFPAAIAVDREAP